MKHSLVCLLCVCLLARMQTLLLFVIDETTSREIAVEVESPETATVHDLVQEVARCKGVNPSHIALSFQGTRLTDWDQPLADTGLSNECRLSLASHSIIELQWNYGAHKVNNSDVLQWDTTQDISQYEWLKEMSIVRIEFYHFHGHDRIPRDAKDIYYQWTDKIVTSHAFDIVRLAAEQHGVDEIPEERCVWPSDLKQAQYAKDLLVAPRRGEYMKLSYEARARGARGCYRFPAGYGLLLRYQNKTRSIV